MGITFAVLAVLTVFFGLGVVFLGRHPVHTAMFLVGTLLCIAVLFLFLAAEFLAFAQVIIYAGAIMVLFLFIIMLLNIREPDIAPATQFARLLGAILIGIVFAFVLHQVAIEPVMQRPEPLEAVNPNERGALTLALAQALLTRYLLPFELVAVLLFVAIIGAVVMGRRTLSFSQAPPLPQAESRGS